MCGGEGEERGGGLNEVRDYNFYLFHSVLCDSSTTSSKAEKGRRVEQTSDRSIDQSVEEWKVETKAHQHPPIS